MAWLAGFWADGVAGAAWTEAGGETGEADEADEADEACEAGKADEFGAFRRIWPRVTGFEWDIVRDFKVQMIF